MPSRFRKIEEKLACHTDREIAVALAPVSVMFAARGIKEDSRPSPNLKAIRNGSDFVDDLKLDVVGAMSHETTHVHPPAIVAKT